MKVSQFWIAVMLQPLFGGLAFGMQQDVNQMQMLPSSLLRPGSSIHPGLMVNPFARQASLVGSESLSSPNKSQDLEALSRTSTGPVDSLTEADRQTLAAFVEAQQRMAGGAGLAREGKSSTLRSGGSSGEFVVVHRGADPLRSGLEATASFTARQKAQFVELAKASPLKPVAEVIPVKKFTKLNYYEKKKYLHDAVEKAIIQDQVALGVTDKTSLLLGLKVLASNRNSNGGPVIDSKVRSAIEQVVAGDDKAKAEIRRLKVLEANYEISHHKLQTLICELNPASGSGAAKSSFTQFFTKIYSGVATGVYSWKASWKSEEIKQLQKQAEAIKVKRELAYLSLGQKIFKSEPDYVPNRGYKYLVSRIKEVSQEIAGKLEL